MSSDDRLSETPGAISASALDILFCAMGAIILLVSITQKGTISSLVKAQDPMSIETLDIERLDEQNSANPAHWPGMQALPNNSNPAIFLVDRSTSFKEPQQKSAQQFLISQYVLQNGLNDFAVIYFSRGAEVALGFSGAPSTALADVIPDSVLNQLVADALIRLRERGVPNSLVNTLQPRLRRLLLMEQIAIGDGRIGNHTELLPALEKAAQLIENSSHSDVQIVLISDGEFYDLSDDLGVVRVAIALVNPSSSRAVEGIQQMQRFASAPEHLLILHGYANDVTEIEEAEPRYPDRRSRSFSPFR